MRLDDLDQLIREEVLTELRRMSERGERQDQRLERLERWTLMPTDYDPLHLPPGQKKPRDIKLVVKEANRETIHDVFSKRNIMLALGTVSGVTVTVIQIVNGLIGLFR